uniref:ABC transporter ATP-binding protein n=1 Tax=uncultured bacterium contig00045 TaxID=1181531 RepID=A0A806KII9_9BACT|nr:ABC transporter ATP-binding protein [uncultured bacterium contig00045]
MAILSLENVKYRYVTPYITVEAVRGVTYSFEQGHFYALRGPSGCGKTTLLSLMAGLDLPVSGDVRYAGHSTRTLNLARHRRENVAVIYQGYNLLPQFTVAENIMYPMELNKIAPKDARERALELLQMVGLTSNEFRRFPNMLSGGQQQRVAIARALGTPARMILADEPTGNLDTENSNIVVELLKKLAHDNDYCVVMVTHDAAMADMADVALQMSDGRLLA